MTTPKSPAKSLSRPNLASTLWLSLAMALPGCINGAATSTQPANSTDESATTAPVALELVRVLPIENIREPSGLTVREGQLYAVSDEDDETIFRLRLKEQVAVAEAVIHIKNPTGATEEFDLEGITTDKNDFLVLAEAARLVLRVNSTGDITSSQSIDDFQIDGLFVTPGAGPEGLAVVGGTSVVAAERQPCGLILLDPKRQPRMFDDDVDYPQLPPRPKDATGLWVDGAELWCLTRNGESVVRFDASKTDLPILGAYSFHHYAPALAFSDEKYGTAEGLAADADHIYVVFDNNDLTQKNDPVDTRPRIAIFHRP